MRILNLNWEVCASKKFWSLQVADSIQRLKSRKCYFLFKLASGYSSDIKHNLEHFIGRTERDEMLCLMQLEKRNYANKRDVRIATANVDVQQRKNVKKKQILDEMTLKNLDLLLLETN